MRVAIMFWAYVLMVIFACACLAIGQFLWWAIRSAFRPRE